MIPAPKKQIKVGIIKSSERNEQIKVSNKIESQIGNYNETRIYYMSMGFRAILNANDNFGIMNL